MDFSIFIIAFILFTVLLVIVMVLRYRRRERFLKESGFVVVSHPPSEVAGMARLFTQCDIGVSYANLGPAGPVHLFILKTRGDEGPAFCMVVESPVRFSGRLALQKAYGSMALFKQIGKFFIKLVETEYRTAGLMALPAFNERHMAKDGLVAFADREYDPDSDEMKALFAPAMKGYDSTVGLGYDDRYAVLWSDNLGVLFELLKAVRQA